VHARAVASFTPASHPLAPVLGPGKSGKSSLIALLEKDSAADKVKPTAALEYKYIRRTTSASGPKDVTHVWELGGGFGYADLVAVPVTRERIGALVLVCVVDLSQPKNAVPALCQWLDHINALTSQLMDQLRATNPEYVKAVEDKAAGRYSATHPDKARVRPCPATLVILANKYVTAAPLTTPAPPPTTLLYRPPTLTLLLPLRYDLFKNAEPIEKKLLCAALRCLAHFHGASLMFTSTNDAKLQSQTKGVLQGLLFRGKTKQATELSEQNPISVPAGKDSFDAIFKAPMAGIDRSVGTVDRPHKVGSEAPMHAAWVRACKETFGNDTLAAEMQAAAPDDGDDTGAAAAASPLAPQPEVDAVYAVKMEELKQYKEAARRAARLQASSEKSSRDKSKSSSSRSRDKSKSSSSKSSSSSSRRREGEAGGEKEGKK